MKKHLFIPFVVFFLTLCLLAGPSVAQAADKPYKIVISSLWPASSIYAKAVLWAKLINENSRLVDATAQEGKGPNIAMKTLAKYPEKRKTFIFFGSEDSWWGAQQGRKSWKRFTDNYDFNNFKHLALHTFVADVLLTADPEIKKATDMAGKTFAASSQTLNSAMALAFIETFKQLGVTPKFQALATNSAIESCRDGLVDVIVGGYTLVGANRYEAAPYLNELLASKKIYPVNLTREALRKMKNAIGHPGVITYFPPGSINENQDYPVYANAKALSWMCDAGVPDKVVTEILRIYYEHVDRIKEVDPSGKILTKESIAALDVPESRYHPAAIEFYKEKGVPVTSLKALKFIE